MAQRRAIYGVNDHNQDPRIIMVAYKVEKLDGTVAWSDNNPLMSMGLDFGAIDRIGYSALDEWKLCPSERIGHHFRYSRQVEMSNAITGDGPPHQVSEHRTVEYRIDRVVWSGHYEADDDVSVCGYCKIVVIKEVEPTDVGGFAGMGVALLEVEKSDPKES